MTQNEAITALRIYVTKDMQKRELSSLEIANAAAAIYTFETGNFVSTNNLRSQNNEPTSRN